MLINRIFRKILRKATIFNIILKTKLKKIGEGENLIE